MGNYTFSTEQIVDRETVIKRSLGGTWLNHLYRIPVDPEELGVGDRLDINGVGWIVTETERGIEFDFRAAYLMPFSEWEGRNAFFPDEESLHV
jgi:hypothetical protein